MPAFLTQVNELYAVAFDAVAVDAVGAVDQALVEMVPPTRSTLCLHFLHRSMSFMLLLLMLILLFKMLVKYIVPTFSQRRCFYDNFGETSVEIGFVGGDDTFLWFLVILTRLMTTSVIDDNLQVIYFLAMSLTSESFISERAQVGLFLYLQRALTLHESFDIICFLLSTAIIISS